MGHETSHLPTCGTRQSKTPMADLEAYKKRAEEAEAVAAELESKYIKLLDALNALSEESAAPASSAVAEDLAAAQEKITKLEFQKGHLARSVKELMAAR